MNTDNGKTRVLRTCMTHVYDDDGIQQSARRSSNTVTVFKFTDAANTILLYVCMYVCRGGFTTIHTICIRQEYIIIWCCCRSFIHIIVTGVLFISGDIKVTAAHLNVIRNLSTIPGCGNKYDYIRIRTIIRTYNNIIPMFTCTNMFCE